MNAAAVGTLPETQLKQDQRGPAMEFTFKSGARPLDGYTIKRGLGAGGFGVVYYAISDGGKEVALKQVQRHLDVELRGVSQCLNLKHPSLLPIYDVRRMKDGDTWVVMEYMSGPSLQDRLAQVEGGLPTHELFEWLEGIAGATDFLHQQGIVHRDLKPGNVFREGDLVRVGDYGLSKFITASRRSGQTQSIGTVHYMAPEISTGNYGKNVDIYSAAVITFEMLCGDVPFDGETTGEVLMKHLTAEPELAKLEPKFRPIFAKALAKNPKDRYQSVREFLDAVRAVIEGKPAKAAEQPAPKTVDQPKPLHLPAALPAEDLKMSLPPIPGTRKAKRRSASEFVWSFFLAGLLSMVLPIPVLALAQLADVHNLDHVRNYLTLSLLAGTASWFLLGIAKFWEKRRVDIAMRRLTMLLFGLALGTGALSLNVWLHDQVPSQLRFPVGDTTVTEQFAGDILRFLLVYATIFSLAFTIPDWAKSACKMRPSRFSLWRVIWPGSVALIVTLIFSDATHKAPEAFWVAGIVAMTSVIVQWVSQYEPAKMRQRIANRRHRVHV